MRWRDKTFGDIADAVVLYRPFIGAVLALVLVAVLLPGTSSRNANDGAGGVATSDGTTFGTTPGGTDASGAATGVTASSIVDPGGSGVGGAGTGGVGGTGGGGSSTGASGGSATGATGGKVAVSQAASASPNCDAKTGRVKVPSLYAAPCVAAFSGSNGGATYQGVTKDKIRIAVYLPQEDPASGAILDAAGIDDSIEQIEQTFHDYVDLFEKHYETYGRKVELVFVQASGADADDASAKADAIKVATEIKAFMSWGGRVLTDAYQDELAARGVPCLCTKAPPIEYFRDHAPYYYSFLMASSQAYMHRAEFIGKMLYGKKAKWSGDPLYQQQNRKIGLIYTETAAGDLKKGVDFFEKELTKYGAKLDDRVGLLLDLTREQEQARTIIARLKDKGITSVALATTYLDPVFLTSEATRQGYFPEWIVIGSALTDTAVWARLYDQSQWTHAFGISQLPGRVLPAKTEPWALYQWHFDGRTPPADDTFAVEYVPVWAFFTGIHLAGPALNPNTFRNGLFSFPPSGGGITDPQISWGKHGFWPWDDYTPGDDATEVWWDAAARGQDETGADGQGMYRYVDAGKRYLAGRWPTRDAKAFDPNGTVVIYDDVPANERPPQYPHQKHG